MKNLIISMINAFVSSSLIVVAICCGGVVRDAKTYRQELLFLEEITQRLAVQQLEQAVVAAQEMDLRRCEELADVALMAKTRVPYHVAMSMFLADLGKDPGEPPPVPVASAWCAERGVQE